MSASALRFSRSAFCFAKRFSRSVRRLEHANSRRRGHKLTHLLQSFCPYRGSEKVYARDVPARPIEVSDQAVLDRVATGREDDRHCRASDLGCECHGEISDDHRD